MDYVRLGSTGLKVSRICLGCMTYGSKKWRDWVLEEEESRPFFRRALEAGINFFDTADMYSVGVSEEIIGRALKEYRPVARPRGHRHQGLQPDGRRPEPARPVPQAHHATRSTPACAGWAPITSISTRSTASTTTRRSRKRCEALDDVVSAGKALYIGASSMFAWQFAKMLHAADQHGLARFVTMQNHYNLVYREEEREMIPLCREEGIGLIPWSPLARGFWPAIAAQEDFGETIRAKTDDFAPELYYQRFRFQGGRARHGDRATSAACRTRRSRSPGCCSSPA